MIEYSEDVTNVTFGIRGAICTARDDQQHGYGSDDNTSLHIILSDNVYAHRFKKLILSLFEYGALHCSKSFFLVIQLRIILGFLKKYLALPTHIINFNITPTPGFTIMDDIDISPCDGCTISAFINPMILSDTKLIIRAGIVRITNMMNISPADLISKSIMSSFVTIFLSIRPKSLSKVGAPTLVK